MQCLAPIHIAHSVAAWFLLHAGLTTVIYPLTVPPPNPEACMVAKQSDCWTAGFKVPPLDSAARLEFFFLLQGAFSIGPLGPRSLTIIAVTTNQQSL